MKTFRKDLEAAGIAASDGQGRRVDFHALRHTLATNLARAGVSPRVAMEMMRHSDMRLTQRTYTDAALLPMTDALEKLPRYAAAVRLEATGTDGPMCGKSDSEPHSCPQEVGFPVGSNPTAPSVLAASATLILPRFPKASRACLCARPLRAPRSQANWRASPSRNQRCSVWRRKMARRSHCPVGSRGEPRLRGPASCSGQQRRRGRARPYAVDIAFRRSRS